MNSTTPTPSPEAEALPTLPVVAWSYIPSDAWRDRVLTEDAEKVEIALGLGREVTALTPRAPAEAAIVALRAERDEAYSARDAAINLANSRFDSMRAAQAEVAELRKERDALQEKVRDYALQLLVNEAQAMGLYDTPATLLGDGGTL